MGNRIERIQRFGIIIGAMKAGTTAAFRALGQNNEIALSREKENDFFVAEEKFNAGVAVYESLWEWNPSRHKIAIEASTCLTKEPDFTGGPKRIASTGRDIRLVYLVRNPIARIQSQYYHHGARGWPLAPLSEGVDESALSYSMYYYQISKYTAVLPRAQIFIATYEHLVEDPQSVLSQICRHFGVSASVQFHLPRENTTKDEYIRPLLIRHLLDHGIHVPDSSRNGFRQWFARQPLEVRRLPLEKVAKQLNLTENHQYYIKQRLADDMRALTREFRVDVNAWGF